MDNSKLIEYDKTIISRLKENGMVELECDGLLKRLKTKTFCFGSPLEREDVLPIFGAASKGIGRNSLSGDDYGQYRLEYDLIENRNYKYSLSISLIDSGMYKIDPRLKGFKSYGTFLYIAEYTQ